MWCTHYSYAGIQLTDGKNFALKKNNFLAFHLAFSMHCTHNFIQINIGNSLLMIDLTLKL